MGANTRSQREDEFAKQMYVYNYRLFDRYQRRVASMAVLSDEQQGWKPSVFEQSLWGCQMSFKFPTVKLLNYQNDWAVLEENDNPFATVVMAHLQAQKTRHDEEKRAEWKFLLTRRLYERGYKREDALNLFRFIDWVMILPEEAEEKLWQEIKEYGSLGFRVTLGVDDSPRPQM